MWKFPTKPWFLRGCLILGGRDYSFLRLAGVRNQLITGGHHINNGIDGDRFNQKWRIDWEIGEWTVIKLGYLYLRFLDGIILGFNGI